MSGPDALLDTNVVIAMVSEAHEHHEASIALADGSRTGRFAVAAHSHAEAYSTLTRRGATSPFRWSSVEAWAAIESVGAITVLVGLTPGQTLETIRSYAEAGGVGARLYDRLIGQVAVQYGIPTVVTWNIGHMHNLFPNLEVVTPAMIGKLPDTPAAC